jgi:transcriptional regulator with XRE-family HTH domain
MAEGKKLTAKQVADRLGASRGTISTWCRKGKFPNAEKAVSPTGEEYWLIPEDDLKDVEIRMGRPKKND